MQDCVTDLQNILQRQHLEARSVVLERGVYTICQNYKEYTVAEKI